MDMFALTHIPFPRGISTCDDATTKLTLTDGIDGTQNVLFLVFFGH